jgi:hypothetical protein
MGFAGAGQVWGRDHNANAIAVWLAGGGVKQGGREKQLSQTGGAIIREVLG